MTREKADFSGEREGRGAGSPRENVGAGAANHAASSRHDDLLPPLPRRRRRSNIFRNTIDPLVPYIDIATLSLIDFPRNLLPKKTLIPLPIMTLISRSAYRLSRRAGQQAKQAQRVAGLSTAAKVAQQVPAMLRADNRVSRTLPKAKEGEYTVVDGERIRGEARRGIGGRAKFGE